MTRIDAEALLSRVINRSRADETFVLLRATSGTTTRFADSIALMPVRIDDVTVQISARYGARYATTSCNALDDAALDRAFDRIETMAKNSPEEENVVPFPDSRLVLEAPLFVEPDEAIDPAWRAAGVASLLNIARAAGLSATGSLGTSDSAISIATSNGLFLYQASSLAQAEVRVFTRNGLQTASGRLHSTSTKSFSTEELMKRVRDTCVKWKDAVEIKPERLTTVFTASAMADLLLPLLQQFSWKAIEEDRSFLRRLDGSSFIGSRMFHESVRIYSDPFSQVLPSMPFTTEGAEVRAASWVNKGVIETIATNRYDIAGTDREARALPTNLFMDGGKGSLDDLIKGTKRGLLVNGFASLTVIDPRNCLLTGSTRDGLFLIENGKITKAVKNLILRETPVLLLKEVLAMAAPETVSPSTNYFPMHIPAMRVKDVMYTQLSGVI